MKLQARPDTRVINCGSVSLAAGTLGFFGDPYWFERFELPYVLPTLKRWRLRLEAGTIPMGKHWFEPLTSDATFVTKSLVTDGTPGEMELKGAEDNFEPKKRFPNCIHVGWRGFRRGYALNAVGLSSPPASVILDIGIRQGRWRKTSTISTSYTSSVSSSTYFKAFVVSFSPHWSDRSGRIDEWKRFVELLKSYMQESGTKLWLMSSLVIQINLSCPNSSMKLEELQAEASEYLDIGGQLGVPLQIKVNLLVPTSVLMRLEEHKAFSGLCLSNTAPFGEVLPKEWWKLEFPKGSPLEKKVGRSGGLSGVPLFPSVLKRRNELHKEGFKKPINAGGGIQHPSHIAALVEAGHRPEIDSVMLGSVAMLRPWRIPSIVSYAREIFDEKLPTQKKLAA